jgi:hypothetical protein
VASRQLTGNWLRKRKQSLNLGGSRLRHLRQIAAPFAIATRWLHRLQQGLCLKLRVCAPLCRLQLRPSLPHEKLGQRHRLMHLLLKRVRAEFTDKAIRIMLGRKNRNCINLSHRVKQASRARRAARPQYHHRS